MPIPVSPANLLAALRRFDKELRGTKQWSNWAFKQSHRYAIRHKGQLYPVKQVVSLATGIPVSRLNGGVSPGSTNRLVEGIGFEVITLTGRQRKGKRSGPIHPAPPTEPRRSPPGRLAPNGNTVECPQGGVAYWWVNHKQTYRQEIDGEYLWSPKKNKNGANNESYNNMTKVMPGDVVFSFADAAVRAVGIALGRAREAPKPPEFASAGDQWGTDPGWQVPVRFKELTAPLRPKEHASQLAPVLPGKYSPIRASGDGNQGVYLAALADPMADKLTRLLAGQVERIVEAIIRTTGGSLADDAAEERIQQRTDIGPTVKKTLVNARRGQGVFRERLERIERKCRVTGLLDRRHLRASHIKPWCECDDQEKLDGFNGLLLSPHVDHLFDRGHISFSNSGELLLSKDLNSLVLKGWGIAVPQNVGAFSAEQCRYLEYHRSHVFGRLDGGRRVPAPDPEESDASGEEAPVVVRPE
jgi:putative restriction endonuclease